jgi:uncharacterized phiE125 gp8 family phage protein
MIGQDRLVSVTLSGSPVERVEPVTRAEARVQLRQPPDSENGLIDGYIAAARAMFEEHAGRQTIDAVYEWTCYPRCRVIEIPRPPMTALVGVVSRDLSGSETEVDPSTYRVVLSGTASGSPASAVALDAYCPPGRIELLAGQQWPTGELRIQRRCGYGPTPGDVPPLIKSALYLLIGLLYRHRSEVTSGTLQKLPLGAEFLMGSFKYAGLVVTR